MAIFNLLVIIFWLIFISYWVVSARSAKKMTQRTNSWMWRWVLLIVLASLLSFIPVFRVLLFPLTETVLIMGTALCGLGIAFAIWARVYLGRNWSNEPSIQENHELITTGPYHFVRHPIYTGILAGLLGTALEVGIWIWFVVFIFFCVMYIWRIGVEEKFMMRQFPDKYPAYKRRTKALIPFVW